MLCSRESLCDIRRECCHHFVSERNSAGRDAVTGLPSRKVFNESIGRDEMSSVRLAAKLSQVIVNFIVNPIAVTENLKR